MDTSFNKTERTFLKLFLGAGGALLLVGLAIWGGSRVYRHWQEGHLTRRATAVLSGGDLKAASLVARRVLQLNPDNVDALRVMGEIAEKAGDPSMLDFRRRVLELEPKSIDDALALVRCALRLNELSLAEKTLQSIEAIAQQTASFHAAAGRVAEMKNDAATSESQWARAVELEPANKGFQFQLALTRLSSKDAASRKAARATLEELRSDPGQRAVAARTLIVDMVARGENPERVRLLARELQDYPEALFSDRVLYLEILRQMNDPMFGDYLARLKKEALANPNDLSSLLLWMVRHEMAGDASNFTKELPGEAAAKWPVPMAIAEAYGVEKDWVHLERLTKSSNWGEYDFLRHAYRARALRGQEQKLPADQELSLAQKGAAEHPRKLALLAQTMTDWGWQDEATELLWALSKTPEMRLQALQTLYQKYVRAEDTQGLFRTLTKFAEIRPDDRPLQNNLAQVSLLLGLDVERARKMAGELAAKEPENAGYVSTYAFALFSKGDLKGALATMDRLSEAQLRDPSVATYYGLILGAAGQKEKARIFLRRSAEATLLPEEKALVATAQRNLE